MITALLLLKNLITLSAKSVSIPLGLTVAAAAATDAAIVRQFLDQARQH